MKLSDKLPKPDISYRRLPGSTEKHKSQYWQVAQAANAARDSVAALGNSIALIDRACLERNILHKKIQNSITLEERNPDHSNEEGRQTRNVLRSEMEVLNTWQEAGALNAVLKVHNLGKAIHNLKKVIPRLEPGPLKISDTETADYAEAEFEKCFPEHDEVQNAFIDALQYQDQTGKQEPETEPAQVFLEDQEEIEFFAMPSFNGREWQVARKNKLYKFDTTWDTYNSALKIYTIVYEGVKLTEAE